MDSFSQTLVYMISILDTYGASEWNTRAIAATVSNSILAILNILWCLSLLILFPLYLFQSAIFFLGIRHLFHKKRGIDWDAAVHAIITGVGSACCIYLSSNAASHLSGVSGMHLFPMWFFIRNAHRSKLPFFFLFLRTHWIPWMCTTFDQPTQNHSCHHARLCSLWYHPRISPSFNRSWTRIHCTWSWWVKMTILLYQSPFCEEYSSNIHAVL